VRGEGEVLAGVGGCLCGDGDLEWMVGLCLMLVGWIPLRIRHWLGKLRLACLSIALPSAIATQMRK